MCYSVLEVTERNKPDSYMKIKKTCQKIWRERAKKFQQKRHQHARHASTEEKEKRKFTV